MRSQTITASGHTVTHDVTIKQLPSGQTILEVNSKIGQSAQISHSVTIGSDDGRDAISNLSDDDLQTRLQQSVDDARANNAGVLSSRARIMAVIGNLK
jgi:hypothetical protein